MKKAITLFIAITIMISGCQESKQVVSLPEADIIYQTIIDRKDVLGFFSLEKNTSSIVDIQMPLQYPSNLNPDLLIGNNKRGNLGIVKDNTGKLAILSKQTLNDICINNNIGGSGIQPFNGTDIIVNSYDGILQIDGNDCTIKATLLTQANLDFISDRSSINSFTLSKNGEYIIVSLWNVNLESFELFQVNLPGKTYTDYGIEGINPAISPDQQRIAYVQSNGIHVMEISGENNKTVVPYWFSDDDNKLDLGLRLSTKPIWSSDGTRIIYHKCRIPPANQCTSIEEYSIYIFDFNKDTEEKVVDGGVNPSWYSQ